MKKIFSFISLLFVVLISGCKFNVSNNINKVPTTSINNSVNENVDNLSELYNNCKKSVVTVLNYASYYDKGNFVTDLYGTGSGFIYAYDEDFIYLYTNAHVVNVANEYKQSYYEIVFFDDCRSYGSLVYSDSNEDVAVMKVSRTNQEFAVASISNSDNVIPGTSVFAIGSPLGLTYSNTITKGIVSNVRVEMETDDITMYLIQIDASLNPGNSGGPLFNDKGEVIGVNTLKLTSNGNGEYVDSFNFAIPINHFLVVANSLVNKGYYSRPKLGINVIDVTKMTLKVRESYGISISKGIYVDSVSNDGASFGILSKGQIINEINNVEITNLADFSCELYKYGVGDKINITTVNTNGNNSSSYDIILK